MMIFDQTSKQIYLFMSFLADLKCLTLDCLEPSPELPSLLMFSGELLVLELSWQEMRLIRMREIGQAGNFFHYYYDLIIGDTLASDRDL